MKINEFKYNIDDIITTDGYLAFCKDNNICYIKTDFFYLGDLNWRGESHPKFISDVCVIGHSDYPVVETISNTFTKVFCINKYSSSKNTFGLPLGITNDCNDSTLHKVYGNKEIMIEVFNEPMKKESLSYVNFDILNYPTERQVVFDKFKNSSWNKIGEVDNSIEGRIRFLRDLRSSKFVFCPRGNGIDTHRIWESLYMGSIPIVKYENTHHLFTDLPILFINEWDEICEGFLNQKYKEMLYKEWNMDKLKISFWLNFIQANK